MNPAKILLASALLAQVLGCATAPKPLPQPWTKLPPAGLFAILPDAVSTPDGMAIAPDGDLVVACPNFADQSKPACLLRIGQDHVPHVWVNVPPMAETGVACPMGIEFGPDGDLYVCDNQGWTGAEKGQFKGRMLRLRIRDNEVVKTTVVAEGMEHPNGVRVHGDSIYVTESLMTKVKDPSGQLVSAVYRFKLDDSNVKVSNTLDDPQIVTTFRTENKFCQYGADGIVFDHKGNLYVGNFGDGTIYKMSFDGTGNVTNKTVYAKTGLNYSLDPKATNFLSQAMLARMRTTDGICVDGLDNLYVADFSNNAVDRVTPDGWISVEAQNGDTDGRQGELNEPGEPIIWQGRVIVSNFDTVTGLDKVDTKHDSPCTLSWLELTQ